MPTNYYPFEANAETGDFTEFSAGKTDLDSKLTNDHFKALVATLGMFPEGFPYRGAYTFRVNLSLTTTALNPAYVQDATWIAALSATIWARFYFQATSDLTMAPGDRMTLFTLQSSGNVDQAVVDVRNNGGVIEILGAQTSRAVPATQNPVMNAPLALDQWHLVELGTTVDSGTGNGTIQFWLDNQQVGSTLTSLTQSAIAQARMGAMNINPGTTKGHLLFDQVVQTAARLGGFHARFPQTIPVTKSGFITLGPAQVSEYALLGGGAADNNMSLHDMNILPLTNISDMTSYLLANAHPYEPRLAAFYKSGGWFNKGVYVRLTGTAPRGVVTFNQIYSGVGLLKQYAVRA